MDFDQEIGVALPTSQVPPDERTKRMMILTYYQGYLAIIMRSSVECL